MRTQIIALFFTFFFLNIAAYAQDKELTIVAVGEAEQTADKIYFAPIEYDIKLKEDEKKAIEELQELISNDFSFYKHYFEIVTSGSSGQAPQYEKWASKELIYVLQGHLSMEGTSLSLQSTLYNVVEKRVMFDTKKIVWVNNIRKFGHALTTEIFQIIKGKEPIFNKEIYFVSDRTSRGTQTRKELYVMDFDGHGIKRVTYHNTMLISPAVSQDNNKILYTLIEDKWRKSSRGVIHKVKNPNLYVHNITTKKTDLVSEVNGINSGAIFADENNIYLTLTYTQNADIYKMNLTNKVVSRVTNNYSDDVDPSINANGSLMTFLSGRSGRAMIYTMDPKGVEKDVKRISFVGRFNASPRFSPDGKEITFASWVDDRFDIYKIDSDGKNLVRLTKNFGSNEEPSFSPDGEFILFTSQRVISSKEAVQDIYIMNKEGEIVRKLTTNYGKCFTPRWTN